MQTFVLYSTLPALLFFSRNALDVKGAANLIAYADDGGYYAAYIQAASWETIGGANTDYN